ncbi:MAG: aspartate aminotransferase family protein [Bacillota bacterium]|nr:aspartate aminotransferase family protein [Bacillota bacterium]
MTIMKTYKKFDLNFVKGEGTYIYEKNGDKYLDFVAGVAVNSLGHSNAKVIEAIKNQSEKLIHISNLYYDDNQISLADKLVKLSKHESVFFCNSGSEAIEGALKVVRKYGYEMGKTKILYMKNSFHGRTMGALAVTGQEKYQKYYKPLIEDVEEVEFNNIEDLRNKMDDDVCGVILEPIQGEGGVNGIDDVFLKEIGKLIEKYDALLIFDEVQSGIGRTGKFFAYQNYDIVPDVVAMAKGLGAGIPIGAFMVNKKADVLTYGDHGCTFGGNPLVTAVSNVVVDTISDKMFLNEVSIKGNYLKHELEQMTKNMKFVKKIKGKGLIIGVEFDIEKIETKDIVNKAIEYKLIIIGAGNNTIRIVPPLTVSIDEIDEFIERFKNTLDSLLL